MKKQYQGELTSVSRRTGEVQYIHTYSNSSDFPEHEMILMTSNGKFPVERVPINEDIWRAIGKALGYRFVVRKSKRDANVSGDEQ